MQVPFTCPYCGNCETHSDVVSKACQCGKCGKTMNSSSDTGWKCSKCGEDVEASFEVCWNCGTTENGVEDPCFRKEPPDAGCGDAEIIDDRGFVNSMGMFIGLIVGVPVTILKLVSITGEFFNHDAPRVIQAHPLASSLVALLDTAGTVFAAFLGGYLSGAFVAIVIVLAMPKKKTTCPKCKSQIAVKAYVSIVNGKRHPNRCPDCKFEWRADGERTDRSALLFQLVAKRRR